MAPLAEVVRAKAMEKGYGAAEVALPVNVGRAMLLAVLLSCSVQAQLTVLASEVLSFRVLVLIHLLLAVHHPSKVWFLAVKALIESARVHGQALEVSMIGVSWVSKSLTQV